MKFKGKIAVWFWAIFLLVNGALLYELFVAGEDIIPMIIGAVAVNIIFVPILVHNFVVLDEENLTLYFGFGKDSLKVSEITEVYETCNPIAASAASFDRIVVKTRRSEMIFSVRDKKSLFEELQRLNPRLKFE